MMNNKVIDVALGRAPADMVIENGMLVNVITGEIYEADIAIADKKIAATGKLESGMIGPNTVRIDAKGKYLAPGFIDAHIHFESSMLTYTEFNRMVLPHGTTVIASDLMEIAIVSGMEGIKETIKESKNLPVKLLYPVPSFMGEEGDLQTIGAALYPEMIEELLKLPQTVGLAEVLYPPILAKNPLSARILEMAAKMGKTAEGHAPALYGAPLNAYASAGIRSDHESTNPAEAIEKLRRGLRVLIREGSAAADLEACIEIITKNHVDPRHCSLVSDDIDMLHIYEKGHLDHKVRMAVKAGLSPITALQMVTINPAQSLKIDDKYGCIAPGRCADIVVLSDLNNCIVDKVIASGQLVVDNHELICSLKATKYSAALLNTVKLAKPVIAEDLIIKVDTCAKEAVVRVIGANPKSLLTDNQEARLRVENGYIKSNIENDILSIACVERHGKNGNIGKSFIHGFGIKSGAIATSVGHDHHNITVIGSNSEDMALAVNRIGELNGGIIIVENKKVVCELALQICGLLSNQSGIKGAKILDQMQKALKARGCTMQSPFMTLAFITLIFIPMYGITDRGLVDVLNFKVIDPVISII